jgi:hypothetical protein
MSCRMQPKAEATSTQLIGSWKLLSYEDRDPGGVPVYPYGKSPLGMLVYDSTGHMAIQIMKYPPPAVTTDDWDKFTVTEKLALFDSYVAYFGRFQIDPERHLIVHLADADLDRVYIGRSEERHYELAGDRLSLSERWTQSGKEWSGIRIFQRLR